MKRLIVCVSSGRPMNVPKMHALGFPQDGLWLVPMTQSGDYKVAGATRTLETPSTSVTDQRQAALELMYAADYNECVMIDDDLRKLLTYDMVKGTKIPTSITRGIEILSQACDDHDVTYAGVGPTDNAYFVKQAVHFNKYVRSAFIVVRPTDPPIWYDTEFRVKEDYDFSAQQLARRGRIARVDTLLASFHYKTNRGGCQNYRNETVEREAISRLLHKWPGKIKENVRRENEVLFKWR